jgi:hypothetical protein
VGQENTQGPVWNADWYRLQYAMLAGYANKAALLHPNAKSRPVRPTPESETSRGNTEGARAVGGHRHCALQAISVARGSIIASNSVRSQNGWRTRRPSHELVTFLTTTFEPSSWVAVAVAVILADSSAPATKLAQVDALGASRSLEKTPRVEREHWIKMLLEHRDLGHLLKSLDQERESLIDYALAAAGSSGRAQYSVACLLALTSEVEQARKTFDAALNATPDTQHRRLLARALKDPTLTNIHRHIEAALLKRARFATGRLRAAVGLRGLARASSAVNAKTPAALPTHLRMGSPFHRRARVSRRAELGNGARFRG